MTPIARWFGAALVLMLAAAPAFAQKKEGAGADGIKVHGHWTIDVKNPDGSVASHHEFENALTPGGGSYLAIILTHSTQQFLGWGIVLYPPLSGSTTPLATITEPGLASKFEPALFGVISADLSVAANTLNTLTLQGSFQAPTASSIGVVFSAMVFQGPSTGVTIPYFTEKDQTQPITVETNQSVQVTVLFTFS